MAGRASKMSDRDFLTTVVAGLRENKTVEQLAQATGYQETTVVQKYNKFRGSVRKWNTRIKIGNTEQTVKEYFDKVAAKSPEKLTEIFGSDDITKIKLDNLRANIVADADMSKLPPISGNDSEDSDDKAASLLDLVNSLSA